MKTISLRELHNKTGEWVRRVKEEGEITITDRGMPIATVKPIPSSAKSKKTWATRTLLPGYAALMKAGKLKGGTDSSIMISEDRTSRDNSVAGVDE